MNEITKKRIESCFPSSLLNKNDVGVVISRGKLGTQPDFWSLGKASLSEYSLFEIGSVTKVFTAAVALKMSRLNRLRLSENIGCYIPEFSVLGRRSCEDLITHRSGLPRLLPAIDPSSLDPYAKLSDSALLEYMTAPQREMRIRGSLTYSNLGYAILGMVLRRIEDKSFDHLIEEYIAVPSGMTDTHVQYQPQCNLITGYTQAGRKTPCWTWDAFAPCGGLVSSARDLSRFSEWLLQSPEWEEAFAPRAEAGAYQLAFGWLFDRATGSVWHNGRTGGFAAYLSVNKHKNEYMIILTNRSVPCIEKFAALVERVYADTTFVAKRPKDNSAFAYLIETLQGVARLPWWLRTALIIICVWLFQAALHWALSPCHPR